MTITRVDNCWFFDQGARLRGFFGFGRFFAFHRKLTDTGFGVWTVGPFCFAYIPK